MLSFHFAAWMTLLHGESHSSGCTNLRHPRESDLAWPRLMLDILGMSTYERPN